jgi:hypothetical protein
MLPCIFLITARAASGPGQHGSETESWCQEGPAGPLCVAILRGPSNNLPGMGSGCCACRSIVHPVCSCCHVAECAAWTVGGFRRQQTCSGALLIAAAIYFFLLKSPLHETCRLTLHHPTAFASIGRLNGKLLRHYQQQVLYVHSLIAFVQAAAGCGNPLHRGMTVLPRSLSSSHLPVTS